MLLTNYDTKYNNQDVYFFFRKQQYGNAAKVSYCVNGIYSTDSRRKAMSMNDDRYIMKNHSYQYKSTLFC